jgi:hypothetical protein
VESRAAWLIGVTLTIAGTMIAWLAWQHPKSPPPPPPGNGSVAALLPQGNANTPSTGASFFDAVVLEPSGSVAHVYQAPSVSSAIVGNLGNGTRIQILCTVQGDPVTSDSTSYYTSSLWDKIATGYIPDANVSTGTSQPTMPNCSNS